MLSAMLYNKQPLPKHSKRDKELFVGVFCGLLVILRSFSLTAASVQQVRVSFDFSSLDGFCSCLCTS